MQDITNIPHPAQSHEKGRCHDGRQNTDMPKDVTSAPAPDDNDENGPDELEATIKSDGAADLEQLSINDSQVVEELPNIISTHPILHDYLMEESAEYRYVTLWRRKGWASTEGDLHFMMLRQKADNPDDNTQTIFYEQMCQIGQEMDSKYNLSRELELAGDSPKVLDLCMAPGGFSGTILNNAPKSHVCGISLPFTRGGHPMCIEDWENREIEVHWLDITMLSAEMGLNTIPPDHPELSEFSSVRPYFGQKFGLIFCDGNVLRTHARPLYREEKERVRLLTSQLVLAFQRIQEGGTLVCRFHKIESIDTASMLHIFCTFSSVYTYKPVSIHGARSSFYMVAKHIQPHHPKAIQAVEGWKKQWSDLTLDTEEKERGYAFDNDDPIHIQEAKELVEKFGKQLIELSDPIWRIQANALRNKPFFRGEATRFAPGRHPRRNKSSAQSLHPESIQGRWTKCDWRSSNISSNIEPQADLHKSASKNSRYLAPQQKTGSYLGDGPTISSVVKPKSFYSSGVPANSGFWRGDPRGLTTDESKNILEASAATENELGANLLSRRTVAGDKATSSGIGRPGGNLINTTNAKVSSTWPHYQTPGHQINASIPEKNPLVANSRTGEDATVPVTGPEGNL